MPEEVIYLAAPISTEGDKMYVEYLAKELRNIGYAVYSPIEDESINNKSNNPKAEDIFDNDNEGIDKADIFLVVETGREQVGTHTELGGELALIRKGLSDRELISFTNNFRLNEPQIQNGIPSASANHYALGGVWKHGTFVEGMTEGLLEYMRDRGEADE